MQNYDMSLRGLNALYRLAKPSIRISAAGGAVNASIRGITYISNAGASGVSMWALPAAKKGMRVKAIVQVAQALRIDPNGTETIALASGVQQAAGKYVTCATVGAYFHLVCLVDGTWTVEGFNGTWTVEA